MVEKYPYYHSARILLLNALHRLHDGSFDQELRHSSSLIPDRSAIFNLLERRNFMVDEEHRKFADSSVSEDSEQTVQTIDELLDTLPQPTPSRQRGMIDATQDYIGYLMQQHPDEEDEEEKTSGLDLIDEFLQKEHTRMTLSKHDNADSENVERDMETDETEKTDESEEEIIQKSEVLTETLAHIYIKQGKFEKAIEIINRLSLIYPKKNRYFADQIRYLEKVMLNNKSK